MNKRVLLLYFLLALSFHEVLISQAQFGISRNDEVLRAYGRIIHKYDTTQTPQLVQNQNGFDFLKVYDQIDTLIISKNDRNALNLLRHYYWNYSTHNSQSSLLFFKKGRILSFLNENVSLQIDPLLYMSIGRDIAQSDTPFKNGRGISISGEIDKKVFFRSSILENQARFFAHIEKRIEERNAIPGQGFYKRYQSGIFNGLSGWDFLNAEGVLTYRPSDHFRASIGHGSFFLGDGYNSLLLSDYADNFFFLELNATIGILNYKNIFAELAPVGSSINEPGDELAPKKYMATHYLSIALSKKIELSLFESVIFGRENHFELQYLNPLILYRVVEQKLDSPDNVMIGFDISYKLNKQTKAYGQLVIDEMRVGEIFKGDGWWGNKIGYQLGLKYWNAFNVDHLDVQLEYNSVRPFTYAHRASDGLDYTIASYSHYNQELAHPLGANFREITFLYNWRISPKWSIGGRVMHAEVGKSNEENVGQNVLLPSDTRQKDFMNRIAQGEKTTIRQLGSSLTYHIHYNYHVDLQFLHRSESSEEENFNVKTTYFGVSFRANMSHQKLDY